MREVRGKQLGEGRTVYILGAGVNKVISWPFGDASPPLIREFFQVARQLDYWPGAEAALRRERADAAGPQTQGQKFREKYQRVYEYIMRFWKREVDEMESFDLEELFTLLQLQADDALRRSYSKLWVELTRTFVYLTTYLAEVLQEFRGGIPLSILPDFAKAILEDKSSVITFNYDTYLEEAIEAARPNREYLEQLDAWKSAADESLPLPKVHNWDRRLAYGVPFDAIQTGLIGSPQIVDREQFYGQPGNELYDCPILKLHGSLNWFTYLPVDDLPVEKVGQVALLDWYHAKEHFQEKVRWPVDSEGRQLLPVIVTPDLQKGRYFADPTYSNLLQRIWDRAREELSQCGKLVVIGYSFSPTDFYTRKLLRESFEKHDLQELVVVNPHAEIAGMVKDLCHFRKAVSVCGNLEEFLELWGRR